MKIPSEKRLQRYQTAMERTLRNTATIQRTGTMVDCRLEDGLRADPVMGLPRMMRLRRMKIILKGYVDVMAGDTIPIVDPADGRSLGAYFVMDKATPRTNARWTEVYVVMILDEMGRASFPTTAIVNIYDPTVPAHRLTNLPVLIYPATQDMEITKTAVNYEWALWIPKGTVYPATTIEPRAGDQVEWSELARPESLTMKRPVLQPVPAIAFLFKATSNEGRGR